MASIDYLLGVDGGGTKTLVRLTRAERRAQVLAQASGPGSALRNGAGPAWDIIGAAIGQAFSNAGLTLPPVSQLAVGIGIAGYNVEQWAADFRAGAPAFGALEIANDGVATLLGAHDGRPGAVIAVGTGTIGIAVDGAGRQRVVDGWGFPTGDDGSGAWMGMRAVHHAQQALDGRSTRGPMTDAVLALCREEVAKDKQDEREALLDWLALADQAAFARLARPVVAHAADDTAARSILQGAAAELTLMADALDPTQRLPLALSGGLAAALQPYLDTRLRQRIVPARADAADGALLLAQRAMNSLSTRETTP
ncbi:ATPase [Herbaspirillum sp. LeCh32-8]|uniref:BadF/BadG/BcrA/BcrD ATPase family protein n=1 Tax=Herbaspirillum sp. LeCh32-8 TaxID=2821356 RepID=UPI001AE68C91|nr:BadF/BadG/BcrA/BcrD ATPase family protein [Herbaspirillum sp. LeCh32-8]MBP0598108.1 ATPase [Herbaspirillum sp. LeCh32-8]